MRNTTKAVKADILRLLNNISNNPVIKGNTSYIIGDLELPFILKIKTVKVSGFQKKFQQKKSFVKRNLIRDLNSETNMLLLKVQVETGSCTSPPPCFHLSRDQQLQNTVETTELPKRPPLLYKRGAVLKRKKHSHSNLTILSDLAKRINLKNQHGTKMKGPSHSNGSAQCVTSDCSIRPLVVVMDLQVASELK